MDTISDLFQDFYVRATNQIATHVSALASRHRRGLSPGPGKTGTGTKSGQREQQMLTAEEVTERRKARKMFQQKRVSLEEAVERRACEQVYDKIWRHHNTMDEVRDEKLRSTTASLAVMGIDLKDLGVDLGESAREADSKVRDSLEPARQCLKDMNEKRYPLGKLQELIAAHKAIVDTLTNVLPSSSSADEILPTLIYTLITTPSEGVNIISNLVFIQRFRSAAKVDGEAAYCLTNLEAAIGFLECVDLGGVRDGHGLFPASAPLSQDPSLSGDSEGSRYEGTRSSRSPSSSVRSRLGVPGPSSQRPSAQRRLSNLFRPPTEVLEAANDAVRSTADQGLKNISNSLDNSFKFLFGRLKEVQPDGALPAPKTLDEARRLINSKPEDEGSETGSIKDTNRSAPDPPKPDKVLGLGTGRRPVHDGHDNSTDSAQGTSSAPGVRRTATGPAELGGSHSAPAPSTASSLFPSMLNSGNAASSMKSFNPLNHIPDMIRGLGRSTDTVKQDREKEEAKEREPEDTQSDSTSIQELRRHPVLAEFKGPIRRFTELQDPSELKMGDMPELLEDYKRLAALFNTLCAGPGSGSS